MYSPILNQDPTSNQARGPSRGSQRSPVPPPYRPLQHSPLSGRPRAGSQSSITSRTVPSTRQTSPMHNRNGSNQSPISQITLNGNNTSPVSQGTEKKAPSTKEPPVSPVIASKWGIGWETPAFLITCYLLAVLFAVAHLILFRYINGKPADGIHRVVPQGYITTASNILSNAFGFALRAALSVAFVQYMWHLMRESAMKVSTIELLFSIRSNPFMLLRGAVIRATPTLCVLALFMWGLQIAIGFPPGAITVVSIQSPSYKMVQIPTFDPTFMGNGSGVEANAYSLANLWPDPGADASMAGFTIDGEQDVKDNYLLVRLAYPVLIKGEAFPWPSPCGSNCSYVTQIEGPRLECTNETSYFWGNNSVTNAHSGARHDGRNEFEDASMYNGTYSESYYNSTTVTPILENTTDGTILFKQEKLHCLTARAMYTINNTYTNNIQSRTVTWQRIDRLVNLERLTHDSVVLVPYFLTDEGKYGTVKANWSEANLAFYRDLNHMSIIDGLILRLTGDVPSLVTTLSSAIPAYDLTPSAGTANDTDGNSTIVTDLGWLNRYVTTTCQNTTTTNVVDTTRFNVNFDHYTPRQSSDMRFNVTEDMLNEYLLNVTTSVALSFDTWYKNANATIYETINVYSFSAPLVLIIPYFASLLLALPFLVLGGIALFRNGVSAADGGFMQIITTSTGSAILDRAAAGGCLGGNESVPKELKDLKIKFGEFIGREEPGMVKRAGFGTESEVIPLKKGATYGIARWI